MVLWQYRVLRERLGNQKEHTAKNPIDDSLFCPDILCEIKVFFLFFFFPQQVGSTNISKQEPISHQTFSNG